MIVLRECKLFSVAIATSFSFRIIIYVFLFLISILSSFCISGSLDCFFFLSLLLRRVDSGHHTMSPRSFSFNFRNGRDFVSFNEDAYKKKQVHHHHPPSLFFCIPICSFNEKKNKKIDAIIIQSHKWDKLRWLCWWVRSRHRVSCFMNDVHVSTSTKEIEEFVLFTLIFIILLLHHR